jgi:hypothetical protein
VNENIKDKESGESNDRYIEVCYSWKRNNCNRGDDCLYRHSEDKSHGKKSGLGTSADIPRAQGISSIKEDNQIKINIREVTKQIDSGAKRTICNNKNAIQNYTVHNEPKHIVGITGDQLEILGEGKIESLFDKVYYAPSADLSVTSVEDLQNKGLTTKFPSGLGTGCYVLNEDGRTVFQTNAGYFINLTALYYNNNLQDNEVE